MSDFPACPYRKVAFGSSGKQVLHYYAMIMQLGVPSFDTLMHNAKLGLGSRLYACSNRKSYYQCRAH